MTIVNAWGERNLHTCGSCSTVEALQRGTSLHTLASVSNTHQQMGGGGGGGQRLHKCGIVQSVLTNVIPILLTGVTDSIELRANSPNH